jgi:porin
MRRAPCRIGRPLIYLLAVLVVAAIWTEAARAAPPPLLVPGAENFLPETGAPPAGPFGFLTGLSRSTYLLGDIWGLRGLLAQYGISLALSETSEVLGNVTGGVRQGFEYDGLTQMAVQLDTQQAFGWYGGTFRASALQIHGRNLSTDNLLTLDTASGIEAEPGARLWELWYQQKFLDEDRLDIRLGQMSLDQAFIVSTNALLFVNTSFGWPLVPSLDLPGGGPAYPLSALGVRLRVRPTEAVTALLAVTNGNPAPNNFGDPQQQNPSGTSFPLNGGVLVFGELQYAYPALGALITSPEQQVRAGIVKVGFWYNSEEFDDLLFDTTGVSLANPLTNGTPALHPNNYSFTEF